MRIRCHSLISHTSPDKKPKQSSFLQPIPPPIIPRLFKNFLSSSSHYDTLTHNKNRIISYRQLTHRLKQRPRFISKLDEKKQEQFVTAPSFSELKSYQSCRWESRGKERENIRRRKVNRKVDMKCGEESEMYEKLIEKIRKRIEQKERKQKESGLALIHSKLMKIL